MTERQSKSAAAYSATGAWVSYLGASGTTYWAYMVGLEAGEGIALGTASAIAFLAAGGPILLAGTFGLGYALLKGTDKEVSDWGKVVDIGAYSSSPMQVGVLPFGAVTSIAVRDVSGKDELDPFALGKVLGPGIEFSQTVMESVRFGQAAVELAHGRPEVLGSAVTSFAFQQPWYVGDIRNFEEKATARNAEESNDLIEFILDFEKPGVCELPKAPPPKSDLEKAADEIFEQALKQQEESERQGVSMRKDQVSRDSFSEKPGRGELQAGDQGERGWGGGTMVA